MYEGAVVNSVESVGFIPLTQNNAVIFIENDTDVAMEFLLESKGRIDGDYAPIYDPAAPTVQVSKTVAAGEEGRLRLEGLTMGEKYRVVADGTGALGTLVIYAIS